MSDKREAWMTGLGFLAFIGICLVASWLGEKMHSPEEYYGGTPSYMEQSCVGCDQP